MCMYLSWATFIRLWNNMIALTVVIVSVPLTSLETGAYLPSQYWFDLRAMAYKAYRFWCFNLVVWTHNVKFVKLPSQVTSEQSGWHCGTVTSYCNTVTRRTPILIVGQLGKFFWKEWCLPQISYNGITHWSRWTAWITSLISPISITTVLTKNRNIYVYINIIIKMN